LKAPESKLIEAAVTAIQQQNKPQPTNPDSVYEHCVTDQNGNLLNTIDLVTEPTFGPSEMG
jgi:hypothetical protein